MDKKTIDQILRKYQQGRASEEEMMALESLADKLLSANDAEVFKSDLEKFAIKKEIREKIEIPSSSSFNWMRIAASIAILLGLSVSLWFAYDAANSPEMMLAITTFGEQKTVVLPDGSEVLLNAQSTLEYPKVFGEEGRDVKLTGEALFQVTKDAQRPFEVSTNELRTTVLGTTFNVSAYEDDSILQVSLVEGSVQVSNGDNKMLLKPGEQSTYDASSSEMIKSTFDPNTVLAWKNREIVLSNTPFIQIEKIVKRKYGVELRFQDPQIAQFTVSGTFKDSDINLFMATICAAKSIRYEMNDQNEVILSLK